MPVILKTYFKKLVMINSTLNSTFYVKIMRFELSVTIFQIVSELWDFTSQKLFGRFNFEMGSKNDEESKKYTDFSNK